MVLYRSETFAVNRTNVARLIKDFLKDSLEKDVKIISLYILIHGRFDEKNVSLILAIYDLSTKIIRGQKH